MNTPRLEAFCRSVGQAWYSPNDQVNEAIQWLLEYGYPVLPIAPQNEQTIVKGKLLYSGKNPSYLDRYARAVLVSHIQFQHRLPRQDELKRWFAHEATGVATLGGWQNTVWIDIDRKHFATTEACNAVVRRLLQQASLKHTFVERTQSGGYHIGVRCRQLPDFTRCCLSHSQLRLGDLLGAGKVCVMAPTQGVDGSYQSLSRTEPVWVNQITDLGIAPKRQPKPQPKDWSANASNTSHSLGTGSVSLERLLSRRVQNLVLNQPAKGDRSEALTAVAREAFGWEWFASQYGVQVHPDAETFCFVLRHRWQLDIDRMQRILNSTSYGRPVRDSTPSLYTVSGPDACLGKLRWARHNH